MSEKVLILSGSPRKDGNFDMLCNEFIRGVVVIPKSTHYEKMVENFDVFDFTLSDEDMAAIAALDRNTSVFFSHADPNMVEWFVKMVEERKKQYDCSKEKKSW